MIHCIFSLSFFFFNDTATTEIYTLSLHDALPISTASAVGVPSGICHTPNPSSGIAVLLLRRALDCSVSRLLSDRKSTRLNSSHSQISYPVFCLKKKKSLQKTIPAIRMQLHREQSL